MIYRPPGGQPVRVTLSDMDRKSVKRLRRAVKARPRVSESERAHRAAIAARTGLPPATVDRIRNRLAATASPTVDEYLAGDPYPFEPADYSDGAPQ